jgi:hypothetical protein
MAKKKLIHIRKPRLVITGKKVKISHPYIRVGRKTGVNLSRSGASVSVRTKAGSLSTRRGCRLRLWPF